MWAGLRNQTLVSREPSHLFTLLAGGAQCLLTPWVRMPEAPQESQPEIGCMGLEEVPTSRNCVKYHPPMETWCYRELGARGEGLGGCRAGRSDLGSPGIWYVACSGGPWVQVLWDWCPEFWNSWCSWRKANCELNTGESHSPMFPHHSSPLQDLTRGSAKGHPGNSLQMGGGGLGWVNWGSIRYNCHFHGWHGGPGRRGGRICFGGISGQLPPERINLARVTGEIEFSPLASTMHSDNLFCDSWYDFRALSQVLSFSGGSFCVCSLRWRDILAYWVTSQSN